MKKLILHNTPYGAIRTDLGLHNTPDMGSYEEK